MIDAVIAALKMVNDSQFWKHDIQHYNNTFSTLFKSNNDNLLNSDATWLSTNFGVIICIECSGIHREMGVHISKIQSLTLDNIGTSQLLVARVMSNDGFNKVFEAVGNKKPGPSSTM